MLMMEFTSQNFTIKNLPKESDGVAPSFAITGFREDISTLLSEFLKKGTGRYADFVNVWEEMKFGYVFGGIQTTIGETAEVHEFAEKCFREAVVLCLPPTEDPLRTAAMYLLYSLYLARPLYCLARIRIHPVTEMLPIVKYAEELLTNAHYDTVYTFLDLYQQKAFRYTLTPSEMGWHTQRSKKWRDIGTINTYLPDVPRFITGEIFSTVLSHDETYSTAKAVLQEQMQGDPTFIPAQLEYVKHDLKDRLQKIADSYECKMQDLSKISLISGAPDNNDGAAPVLNTDMESTGIRRQRLRREQMHSEVKPRW